MEGIEPIKSWYMNKYHNDENFRKNQQTYINNWTKNKYATDEVYRAKVLNYKKEYYKRKKELKATAD